MPEDFTFFYHKAFPFFCLSLSLCQNKPPLVDFHLFPHLTRGCQVSTFDITSCSCGLWPSTPCRLISSLHWEYKLFSLSSWGPTYLSILTSCDSPPGPLSWHSGLLSGPGMCSACPGFKAVTQCCFARAPCPPHSYPPHSVIILKRTFLHALFLSYPHYLN